jgi:hypothetical protein
MKLYLGDIYMATIDRAIRDNRYETELYFCDAPRVAGKGIQPRQQTKRHVFKGCEPGLGRMQGTHRQGFAKPGKIVGANSKLF